MNFAYGGTGVFNTLVNASNMSTQISNFQQLIDEKWYTNQDLNTSIALVSLAGNDYGAHVVNHGNNPKDLATFTELVVRQLVENLKRIKSLGVGKIAVNAMQPLGCLPQLTAYSSVNSCNENWNLLSSSHNQKLLQQMQKLNSQTNKDAVLVLDVYSAFLSAITKQMNRTDGDHKQEQSSLALAGNPLKPCCVGMRSEYSCGSVDGSGVNKYSVCKNPESSFFWDNIHPSQNGWQAIYLELEASLYKLF
ncbi:hypothetical protein FNV43_RR18894 [Rhamnella rubrinervis]|uniref:Uncharacterized protein n=1 Tax=Rhamnella rubrinervis TaxID=2594499 RepID=A0A8K0E758_9ROSA|nr:hypothetical protein FNV43_RR18894 [Rhamnella rubrinervis]